MSEVVVRALEEADISEVLSLERSLAAAPHWREEDYIVCLSSSAAPQRLALVATAEQRVVGCIVAVLVAGEAELESVFVSALEQGKGIGNQLLRALLRQLGERKIYKVFLEVRASNASALALYGKTGFQESGRRALYYSAPQEDAILMSLTLPGNGEVLFRECYL